MTPLNTIIEEEKKEFDDRFDFQTKQYAEAGYVEAQNESTVEQLKAFLTTAMQRAYEAGKASDTQENTPDTEWEEKIVKHLVDRFLGWRLPKDFHPDGGISFDREYNVSYNANQGLPPSIHEPVGTNLFTAEQAKEMFRFLLENEDGTPFLSSRDTYWKERVRKDVEHILDSHIEMAKHSLKNAVADQVAPYKHQLGRLLQAKEEILDTLLDNLK